MGNTEVKSIQMKYRWLILVVLATLLVVFAGCSRPGTPQEVATEFWQAMAEGKAEDAVDLSTLTDTRGLDGFGQDWLNTLPDFGRVVIDADQATIVTYLPAGAGVAEPESGARREITTYLVRIDDQWSVDYQRTYEAVTEPSALSGLKSDISKLREQLEGAVGRSREQISERMDRLVEDFDKYSDETGKKAEEVLKSFGQSLEELRERIEKSLEEAEKNREKPTDPDQDTLEQASI
jgi:ElaB/YqjD/DUF883 family membrane-anchored ribosome-binding protein